MIKKIMTLLFWGISFSSFSSLALADECNYQFDQGRIEVQFEGVALQTYFTIRVDRPNAGRKYPVCEVVAVFFDRGNAQSYNRKASSGSNQIAYTLENINPTGTLKSFADHSGTGEYLSSPINHGETRILTGLFKIPEQYITGGEQYYSDVVNVTIYGFTNGYTPLQEMTKQMVIGIRTKKTASLSFVDEGGIFDESKSSSILDFGVLTQGKNLGKDLIVKSNSSYRLKLGSSNNGRFKHESQNTYIPYTLNINNSPFSLANTSGNPQEFRYVPTGSAAAGDRYNLRFIIGSVPQSQAFGQYSDYLTATIEVQ